MYLSAGATQFVGSLDLEIPEGDAGTEATIERMRQFIYQGVRDVNVNRAAVAIVHSVPAHRPALEAKAIYDWVRKNIRFTPDISSAETLRPAAEILQIRAGDCDCINGVLLPTLFSSVGLDSRLVTVAADSSRPELFSHIYPEVQVNGQWTPADAAAEHAVWGKEPGHVYRKRVWEIEKNSYQDLKGLGQDDGGFDWSTLAQDITVGTTGAANIIKAVNAPYAPTTIIPSAGYPQAAQQLNPAMAVQTAGGGSVTILLGGGVLLLIALFALHR